jgi:hypothetical protein
MSQPVRLLRLLAFSCGEPAAGAAPKAAVLPPDAPYALFAEVACRTFPTLSNPRLYVPVLDEVYEVSDEATWQGALAFAHMFTPGYKVRRGPSRHVTPARTPAA